MFNEMIADFDVTVLERRQQEALKRFDLGDEALS
jgi:hypothetical protein